VSPPHPRTDTHTSLSAYSLARIRFSAVLSEIKGTEVSDREIEQALVDIAAEEVNGSKIGGCQWCLGSIGGLTGGVVGHT
jgi:hypothetical protein